MCDTKHNKYLNMHVLYNVNFSDIGGNRSQTVKEKYREVYEPKWEKFLTVNPSSKVSAFNN